MSQYWQIASANLARAGKQRWCNSANPARVRGQTGRNLAGLPILACQHCRFAVRFDACQQTRLPNGKNPLSDQRRPLRMYHSRRSERLQAFV